MVVVNPIRMMRVLLRALCVLFPFLFAVLFLSAGTEVYVQRIPTDDLQRLLRFWPYIVRNMVPGLASMLIAYWLAAHFVKSLYGLERLGEGSGFLWRWRFGQVGFSPYMRIQEGDIDKGKDGVLSCIGGPGMLVLYHDSAAVLSRAGRITCLERSKYPALKPFEKVYKVIDLRPQRKRLQIEAMTREGIPITCEVDIRYQIRGKGQKLTKRLPFAMSARDALTAATCTWKCEPHVSEDGELDWEKLVTFAHTMGGLRSILARCPLDQLIRPAYWAGHGEPYRQMIRDELERELRLAASEVGAEILSINLGDIEVQDAVTKQWIDAWKLEWERQMMERRAEGEAAAIAQLETAKAQAQAETILALMQSLQSLVGDADALQSRLGLLRIVAMLSHMSNDPQTQAFLPAETLHALAALQDPIAGTKGQQA